MHILMISPQFRPLVGGYERAAERLSAALAARGHAVTVIAERRNRTWPAVEAANGTRLQRLWCIYRPGLHMITSLLSLAAFLAFRGRRFDVWHVHQYGVNAATAIALGKALGRPVVLKLTSSADQGLTLTLAQSRLPQLLAYWHRRVNAVVALTRETAAEAQAFGIAAERIHVLGNGVDPEIFYPRPDAERLQLKQKLGIGPHPVVIFVGRLTEAKNIVGLLKAWRTAVKKFSSPWQLVVVGTGPLHGPGERLATEYQIMDSVRFVGHQKNIDQWLGASDLYISTSWHEGLSNTLLEAMATGLPVVATRVSGVPELVEETNGGLVVEPGDMEGVAEALVQIAADVGLRKIMGTSSRRTIEEKFTLEQVTYRVESLYFEVLNKKEDV